MLELTEVTTWLNDKFNTKGQAFTPSYTFNISAEIGENKGNNVVNGILISETPTMTPISEIKEYKYKFKVTFSITAPTGNYNLKNVEKIVGQVAEQYNGNEITFANGKGVVTFSLTGTKNFKIEAGQGGIVPLTFFLDINYVEGLITSAGKHWLLNGQEIPFLSESVIIEKQGKISPVNNVKYQQVFMTTQMKWYHFRFPFVNNTLCNELYKDLLQGDMNKRYSLSYYDGVNYTEQAPYTTAVVIFRNGDADSQKPDTSMFDIMFADADNGKNTIRYELGVLTSPFDSSTENTRWFDSENEQKNWYVSKLQNGGFCDILAPNINSLYLTNQIYVNKVYEIRLPKLPYVSGAIYYEDYYYDDGGIVGEYKKITSAMTQEEYDEIDIVYKKPVSRDLETLLLQNKAVIRLTQPIYFEVAKPTYAIAKKLNYAVLDGVTYKYVGLITEQEYNSAQHIYSNQLYTYYDIVEAQQGLDGQVLYDLKLDSVQTCLFAEYNGTKRLQIDDSFISKAHLDRWIYGYEEVLPRPEYSTAVSLGYYYLDGTVYKLITSVMTQEQYDDITHIYEMTLTFNGKADSKLFEREDIRQLSKRLVERKKLKYHTSAKTVDNVSVEDWINKNIICWAYVLISKGDYTVKSIENSYPDKSFKMNYSGTFFSNNSIVDYGYSLLCFPIYDTSEYTNGELYVTSEPLSSSPIGNVLPRVRLVGSLEGSILENMKASFFSIKLSMKPPFNLDLIGKKSKIVSNNLYIQTKAVESSSGNAYTMKFLNNPGTIVEATSYETVIGTNLYSSSAPASLGGVFYLVNDEPHPIALFVDITLPQIKFNKSEIVGANKNKKFNPKLNSSDYKDLTLAFIGSSFNYDIQKMSRDSLSFKYNEMVTADITKGILRLMEGSNPNDYIFNQDYCNSYNGFTFSDDLNLPFSVSEYADYIANNKNAYAQLNAQLSYNTAQTNLTNSYLKKQASVDIASSTTKTLLNPTSKLSDISGGVVDAATTAVKTSLTINENKKRTDLQNNYEKTKFDMSIDNMKNAPEDLRNNNGNAIFSASVVELGIYAEIYEGLDTELESANDIMFRDGYNLNRFEEPNEDVRNYCHTRKYFNYIKATLGNMRGYPMSSQMRADLSSRFENGIRFWHQDTVDYTKENYELKIEQ